MEVGAESKARYIDVQSGEGGTRSFMPLRSSGVTIGFVEVEVCRNPLSQILSIATRFAFAICART